MADNLAGYPAANYGGGFGNQAIFNQQLAAPVGGIAAAPQSPPGLPPNAS